MLFYSFFKSLIGKEIVIELKNDLAICGTLHSVDQYLNIKMVEISMTDPDKYPHLLSVKNCFIRGSVIRYVQLPADEVDINSLEEATRREAESLKPADQQIANKIPAYKHRESSGDGGGAD